MGIEPNVSNVSTVQYSDRSICSMVGFEWLVLTVSKHVDGYLMIFTYINMDLIGRIGIS